MYKRQIIAIASLCLTASACTTATMKVPASVADAQPLKIEGHSGGFKSFKEKDLKIGSYEVTNIDRDWDKGKGVSSGPFSHSSKKKAYRFDVKSQARTMHAECTEQSSSTGIAGFSKDKLSFNCACKEGDADRVTLEIKNGAGSAQLGADSHYEVVPVHQSEQGATVSSTLGYEFQGAQGEGVIDVSGNGRAWVPAQANEDEVFGLVCSYASLLLYRPTE